MKSSAFPVLLVCALLAGRACADASAGSPLKISGFASVVGGTVLSGQAGYPLTPSYSCPCYVADWYNSGVYEKAFSLTPESRAGVQAVYHFSPDFSATLQLTTHAVDPSPRADWAYVSYRFGDWELQAGRKRIPLYFFSDFEDVGLAYPWVSPPSDLYGWEANDYNGASLRRHGTAFGGNYSASIFGGAENVVDDRYFMTYSTERVDSHWTHLAGGDFELEKDWWTLRFVYVQNDIENHYVVSDYRTRQKMQAYGVAFNADFENWFVLSEAGQNNRRSPDDSTGEYKAPAFSVGAGYRHGKWTPFLSVGQYRERDPGNGYVPVRWRTAAMTLRYDFNPRNAAKLQWNYNQDVTENFTGNASILRASYDMTF